jgi:ABC-type glycerol-3-phosphate transport system permease component
MAVTAFRPDSELYHTWRQPNAAPLWTFEPTLEHLKGLLQTTAFPTWMWNTMLIAIVSTIISLICGMLAGYALARLRFRGSEFLGTAIFITYLVPQTLLFIPLADIVRDMQLGNTPWALMLTYPTILIPFCTGCLMGYFKTSRRSWRNARASTARRASARWCASSSRSPSRASSRPASSPSRCRGTSSSTRWCSWPRPTRRPCRWGVVPS